MMKLAILGATGQTGMCLVEQALEEGHEVVAIVRSQSHQLTPLKQYGNLKVELRGDITSIASLKEHFAGCDAVISCLGSTIPGDVFLYSQSIKIIVAAMRETSIKRLIAMTSWATFSDPNDRGPNEEWILQPLELKNVLENMAVMETYLKEEAQDLDFTTVRPPGLTDGPKTALEIVHEERNFVAGSETTMRRADVARFLLQCLKTDEFNKKWIAIGVKP